MHPAILRRPSSPPPWPIGATEKTGARNRGTEQGCSPENQRRQPRIITGAGLGEPPAAWSCRAGHRHRYNRRRQRRRRRLGGGVRNTNKERMKEGPETGFPCLRGKTGGPALGTQAAACCVLALERGRARGRRGVGLWRERGRAVAQRGDSKEALSLGLCLWVLSLLAASLSFRPSAAPAALTRLSTRPADTPVAGAHSIPG